MGTYLHGILDNQSFVDYLLEPFAEKVKQRMVFDYAAFKEEQYDKLAALIRSHVNMPLLYKIMKRDD
jgi:adenosylcobyric acid synthase